MKLLWGHKDGGPKYAELQIFKLKVACVLIVLMLLIHLAGCSTANDWRPARSAAPVHTMQICVQRGSKLYDRVTGQECLNEQQRRRIERSRCKTPVQCAKMGVA